MLFALHLVPFRTAFSTISPCVLHHFTLYFAPKRTAFCTILHCVLHQNAPHFAPNSKKKRLKWQAFEINIHFTAFTDQPLPSSKTTFARIVFLGQGERLVDKKGTYYVKNHAENKTKQLYAHTHGQQHRKSMRLLLPASTAPK